MDDALPVPGDTFATLDHYAGFDWAKDQHQLAVVDKAGKVLLNFAFDHDAEGWALARQKLAGLGRVGVAIETSRGPAVEQLLDLVVYPLHPLAAQHLRQRKAPGGKKSDELDGWCFADALRTDGQDWRPLRPQDEPTAELRLLCRDEIALIEQRTALVNQLRAALHEYYPTALKAFDDWTAHAAWEFVIAFPTPEKLLEAGQKKWMKFFRVHKLYQPESAEKRVKLFVQAGAFTNPSRAVINAKSLLAVTLAHQLIAMEKQLAEYRRRIEKLFAEHPDHDSFGSLPGAGQKLAPRLLGEIGGDRGQFDSPEALQCYAGTAPVTRQSGKSHWVCIRLACNKVLRATVHLWADLSRQYCAWAQAYYQQKREQGKKHAAALRCLGQRWLKILWTLWQRRESYNETLHTQNQVKHGSWVLRPPAAAAMAPA